MDVFREMDTRSELQLDITRDAPQDDNAFQIELNRLIDNSKNIHGEETAEGRLRFEIQENPRSLVRAVARNDRLSARACIREALAQLLAYSYWTGAQ